MLLSGRGTTRIKRGHRIWPNHTPRSMSIQWDTVLFGRMGSPNIYVCDGAPVSRAWLGRGPLPQTRRADLSITHNFCELVGTAHEADSR